ncbi:acetyltransferase [Dasineura jujubifolia toursvirus 2a]|nr:acetyltransferase [Dasineura jujubifolia toursvirus 2a]
MLVSLIHKIRFILITPISLNICAIFLAITKLINFNGVNSILFNTAFVMMRHAFIKKIRLHYDPKIIREKRLIMISNHIYSSDIPVTWFGLHSLKKKKLIYNSKSSLSLYGKIFSFLNKNTNFIFLNRNLPYDYITMVDACSKIKKMKEYTTVIFPEGTLFSHSISNKVNIERAKNRDINVTENVLIPKTKGFKVLLETLYQDLDGIIDCTLSYSRPITLKNFILGKRSTVDIYMNFLEKPKVEESEEWLLKLFYIKDKEIKNNVLQKDYYFNIRLRSAKTIKMVSTLCVPWLLSKIKTKFIKKYN